MNYQPRIIPAAEPEQQRHPVTFEELAQGMPMRQLFSSILHELHQPLVAIRLLADSGNVSDEGNAASFDKLRAMLKGIGESAEVTIRTINRLRGFVDGQTSTLQPTDVNQVVSEVLRLAEIVAQARGIAIIEILEPELDCICADGGALQHVFLNLVFNAIEAIDQQGDRRVSVETRKAGDVIEIVVSDTGCGISEEDQSRLFVTRFTTKQQGSGLGLGIVRDIVQQHGGDIALLESLPGAGTSFCVRLPTLAQPSTPTDARELLQAEERPIGIGCSASGSLERLDAQIARGEQLVGDQEILLAGYASNDGVAPFRSRHLLQTMTDCLSAAKESRTLLAGLTQLAAKPTT